MNRSVRVDVDPLVNLQEIAEIELFIIKRLKEFTLGDHASVFKGSGFNFVGVRDWEPGDRVVDRLGAVVDDELQPADHPRLRAGQ